MASGPQDGLGQGGLRLKWAKGRFGRNIDGKIKVPRMGLHIVESLSGLQQSIFSLSTSPNSMLVKNLKNISNYMKFIDFLLFPLFGSLGLPLFESSEVFQFLPILPLWEPS